MRSVHVALGAALFMVMGTGLAAASSTVWYLDPSTHASETSYLLMCQDTPCGGTADVLVPKGKCQDWASDQKALKNVNFSKDGWSGNFDTHEHDTDYKPHKYPGIVGFETGNSPTPSLPVPGNSTFIDSTFFHVDVGSYIGAQPAKGGNMTVPKDNYLVFRFCNNGSKDVNILTNGVSWIQSPDNSDPFPLPELAVGALSLAGLGAVALVAVRSRKA